MRDEYKLISAGSAQIKHCPFCGSKGELYEYENQLGYALKVVMCSNNGDDENGIDECPMYMPTQGFYQARKVDALAVWNKRSLPESSQFANNEYAEHSR